MNDDEELPRRLAELVREESDTSEEEGQLAPLSKAEVLALKSAAHAAFEPSRARRAWVGPAGAALVLAAACIVFFLRPTPAPGRYELELDLTPAPNSRGNREVRTASVTELDFIAVLRPSAPPGSEPDARVFDVAGGAPRRIETKVEHAPNGAIRIRGRVAPGHPLLFTVGPAAVLDERLRQEWILDTGSAPPNMTIIRWPSTDRSRTP